MPYVKAVTVNKILKEQMVQEKKKPTTAENEMQKHPPARVKKNLAPKFGKFHQKWKLLLDIKSTSEGSLFSGDNYRNRGGGESKQLKRKRRKK